MRSLRLIIVLAVAAPSVVAESEIDFDTEIVPLLSKAGCNAAACHGGAAGQAGFRLSLFGGDPAFDFRMIVHELEGRRVNFVHPRESLFIAKPSGQLDHGGGEVLDLDGSAVDVLESWVAAGARRLTKRKLKQLLVTPSDVTGDSLPLQVQLQVRAEFDDGWAPDVSEIAVYTSQSETALSVSPTGLLKVTKPGRQSAIVRFGDQIRTVLVTTPIGEIEPTASEHHSENWIDDEIDDVLKTLRLVASPATDDASFLRRVTLDLTGRLPTESSIHAFLQDTSDRKRQQLVDHLIDSVEFTEYWTHLMASMLRLRVPATDQVATEQFYAWLREHVEHDTGWDEMASQMLVAEGDTHVHGEATFHRFFSTAREQAEYVSEVFLGVRMRCANCHNHPLDKWTQDDYHGLAQIFAVVQRGRIITISERGEVSHPRTGMTAIARLPGVRFLRGPDNRRAFADWMTAHDNQYFARAMVGRIWQSLMGRGLISPADDMRETNPATHPRLLERLSHYFADHGYRIRPLIRLISTSAAYGRSTHPTHGQAKDDRFYSHALEKPLSAEVLADAISDVTGVGSSYGSETVRRAISVVDRRQAADELQFLGQCLPDEGCSVGGQKQDRGIASKLHLMNGELLNRKVSHGDGHLAQLLQRQVAATDLVHGFFLRALSRPASEAERAIWSARIDEGTSQAERASRSQDFLWALLNCHEFTTNH